MSTQRGFGVAGALDKGIAAELGVAAETAGYATFWANDTPNGDGLASLAAVAARTQQIGLGVGVIPIDRVPADTIAARIRELGLPEDRLTIGIGSGGITGGAREAVRLAALALRDLTLARVVVGALGPRMCETAGSSSDGVLLNWLIPSYVPILGGITHKAATDAGRERPWIGAYVRVALLGQGLERVREEADRYASYPAYAAHFQRMNVSALQTCVTGSPDEVAAGLAAFGSPADEVVVRAIAATETLSDYLDVLRAGAPK